MLLVAEVTLREKNVGGSFIAVGLAGGTLGVLEAQMTQIPMGKITGKSQNPPPIFLTVTINGPSLIFIDSILRHTRLVQPTPTHQTWSKEQSYGSDTFLDV